MYNINVANKNKQLTERRTNMKIQFNEKAIGSQLNVVAAESAEFNFLQNLYSIVLNYEYELKIIHTSIEGIEMAIASFRKSDFGALDISSYTNRIDNANIKREMLVKQAQMLANITNNEIEF